MLFTSADKGNTTVAFNRNEYNFKVNELLSNQKTYEIVRDNPLDSTLQNLYKLTKRWFDKKYIDNEIEPNGKRTKRTYNYIPTTDGVLYTKYGSISKSSTTGPE